MKFTVTILFFVLCSLLNSINAQPPCPTCPNGQVEIILVFPDTTTSNTIFTLKNALQACTVDSIPTIRAYLWRVCKGNLVFPDSTYHINSPSDVIGVIDNEYPSSRHSVGAGANDSTRTNVYTYGPLKPIKFDSTTPLLPSNFIGFNEPGGLYV